MRRMPIRFTVVGLMSVALGVLALALFGLVPLAAAGPLTQDNRSLVWDRYDVTIDQFDMAANRFRVTESYDLAVQVGPYRFGTASIPQDRLESIESLSIYENGEALRQSCAGSAGTYCATDTGGDYEVQYTFTRPLESGATTHIEIVYVVQGALRSYEDGDQLYWVAIPSDRSFPIRDSLITVELPQGITPDVIATYPDDWPSQITQNIVMFRAPGQLGANDEVEVRVQYAHNPAMAAPGWQGGFDRRVAYEETWKPLVTVVLIALGVLIAIGGVLFVYTRYAKHGRDPEAVVVPEYLSEPPSDERPGVVGVLLDETADVKDIMGTLVDLAQRGYVVFEQKETGGVFGMFEHTEFEFHRTEKSEADLRGYEQTLLHGVFGGKQDVTLSDLRNKFYTKIPAIREQLYRELVAQGYFTRSPDTTRKMWLFGSIGMLVLAGAGFFVGVSLAETVSFGLVAPPIGLGITGFALMLASQFMPAKTPKGAQDAAKWRAFRRYLSNVERYSDVSEAAEKFDRFMGYAVVFGLEKKWVNTCAPAMTSMPTWYYPTYLGGPWGRGYRRGYHGGGWASGGAGGGIGDINLGGPGGLNDMSRSLTSGLNAMSSGMTQMLNDASRTFTSKPSSSGSGGKGGFSGGGFSGGGGSGGGSRGFG